MKSFFCTVLFCTLGITLFASSPKPQKLVVGYVFGSRVLDVEKIDACRLTHIHYAFAEIVNNEVVASRDNPYDDQNIPALRGLKAQNPALQILISIGGWGGSGGFSDAALTPASREAFTQSAIAYMTTHQFDGIDIDWEYPGQAGAGNTFRAADKENFTRMLQSLRQGLDSLARVNRRPYLLSIAAAAGSRFLEFTEMGQAAQYLDYVTIMSYDFTGAWTRVAGHHTNLFASLAGEGSVMDAAQSVTLLRASGVAADKLLLGAAFYGKSWVLPASTNTGLYETAQGYYQDFSYQMIRDSLIAKAGFKRYWDKQAKAHYIFHPQTKVLVSYDSVRSIRHKMRYIRRKRLGGIMFWEYFGDSKGELLRKMGG